MCLCVSVQTPEIDSVKVMQNNISGSYNSTLTKLWWYFISSKPIRSLLIFYSTRFLFEEEIKFHTYLISSTKILQSGAQPIFDQFSDLTLFSKLLADVGEMKS